MIRTLSEKDLINLCLTVRVEKFSWGAPLVNKNSFYQGVCRDL